MADSTPARDAAKDALNQAEVEAAPEVVKGQGGATHKARPAPRSRGAAAVPAEATASAIVTAADLRVSRPALETAGPGRLEMERSAAGRVEAKTVAVTQGAIGAAQANEVSIQQGALGAAIASDVTIRQSGVRMIVARTVHMEQTGVQSILADRVTMGHGSGALIVFARRVDGEIRTLLDWRGGLAFGAGLGLVLSLFRRGRRRR